MNINSSGTFHPEAQKRTVSNFQHLNLSDPILRAISREGYVDPTEVQLRAIPSVMEGRDVLGCAQTGTGKTAAFALPILHRLSQVSRERPRRIKALVLSPTRELASQIQESFRAYGRFTGLRSAVVYGGVSQVPQARALREGVEILIATPGRLLDLMSQQLVDLRSIEVFVLDEADRMLDMGFIYDVRRIISSIPAKRQTLLFSATMPAEIQSLANSVLRNPVTVRVNPVEATADRIAQTVQYVPKASKPDVLCELLRGIPGSKVLVFTRTKHGADRLVRQLGISGFRASAIHGNKSQNARQSALQDFRIGRTSVLVATDLASRGLDVEQISHVVNFDLPMEPETYVHRIGRTARAGASGIAVSFCDHEERLQLFAIERMLRKRIQVHGEPEGQTDMVPPRSGMAAISQTVYKSASMGRSRRRRSNWAAAK